VKSGCGEEEMNLTITDDCAAALKLEAITHNLRQFLSVHWLDIVSTPT
jgi:hypothetical protein